MHDFGRLDLAAPVTHSFQCLNPGSKTVIIRRVEATCGCLLTREGEDTIPSGKSGEVTVTFNTGDKTGPIDAILHVVTDAGADTLRIRAEVVRNVSIEPPELDFRKVFRGDTVSMTALVRWNRTEPATFDTATWGPHIHAIKIDRLGKNFAIRAWIAPQADKGVFADTIRLGTGSAAWPFLPIPVRGEIAGRIVPEPSFMDFGSISAATRNHATVTLRSLRKKSYVVTKIETHPSFLIASVNRSPDSDWSAQGLIYPGAPLGAFEGWIKLYMNQSAEPEAIIPVSGTVIP